MNVAGVEHLDTETKAVPHLDRLDAEGVAAIHDASMHVVEEVGIQLNHERARELFATHGATVGDDNVVTVPRDLVEERVEMAPAQFTLHARNPDRNVVVGGDGPTVRAPGYGPSNVRTFTDGRRRSRLSDYEDLLKLSQVEDVITCTGYDVCDPVDVEQSARHVELLERSLALTDQPVMGPTHGERRARTCMDMVAIAVGDRDLSRPYVAGLINTVPPRCIDTEMLGGLLTYAEHGQPLVVSSLTMAGASGPASLAASMAQANAENLVGITLAQLVNPGTPVVYGVPSSNIDVRYGSLSVGSPESALFAALAGQMGRYYGLPSRGGGALSDSKAVDYQGGFESMLVQAVTEFSGVDYVLHSAGILESYSTISPEKFVLDCEGLRYLDRFQDGFPIDGESFPMELMAEVGSAGHFLSESRTLERAKSSFYRPSVADKRAHDDWADDGTKSAYEMAHERVQQLLAEYERPRLDADVERELASYVENHRSEAN